MAENAGANSLLFGGLVFHVDTRQKDGTNNSSTYEARAKNAGGKIEKALTAKVTHLVWKDGDAKVRPLAHPHRAAADLSSPRTLPLSPRRAEVSQGPDSGRRGHRDAQLALVVRGGRRAP